MASISFTEDFLKRMYDARCKGISIAKTLRENGIDPDILGISRIKNLANTICKCARSENGFADGRKQNYHHKSFSANATVEDRVKQLEHE